MAKRFLLGLFCVLSITIADVTVQAQDPCDGDACCVNPDTCVVTDKETLEAITVDEVIDVANCDVQLGAYVAGGDGVTGLAPEDYPTNLCGLSFSRNNVSPADSLNALDHQWLASRLTPKVVDFGAPVNTVFVFVAVDHGPLPEEGLEQTVWGSDSPDISNFPDGWTLASLTTVWKKGWEDPVVCQGQDNADDFTGQYSFLGEGFRYVATHADFSISIFNTPAHLNWSGSADSDLAVPGWQSSDDEIDAIGAPVCPPGTVVADAGADQVGILGQDICFNAANSTGRGLSFSWDLDGDKEIDTIGEEVCITCTDVADGEVTVFVTEVCDCSIPGSTCACVDSDTVHYSCTDQRPVCLGEPATDGCTFIIDGIEVPDQPCVGTPYRDVIHGTDGPDVISGLGGNDIIKGRGGDDLLCGDAGSDALHGNDDNDTLDGGDDHDNLQGNKGFDRCLNGENIKKGCEVVM